ncbi:MAG: polyphosphate kinase 2 family protein [Acidimicrobiia bacterium]|nr:polyphosphate kinase 2 family protein [Acidimicrobiia bacterium]
MTSDSTTSVDTASIGAASVTPLDIDRFRVKPDQTVDLASWDPQATPGWELGKKAGKDRVDHLNNVLEELQELLWAQGKERVLVVLQAMDAGGKDGTIKHVFDGVNPSGVKVASFKKPSSLELSHDYLWRVHAQVPADGELVIFNRSHYEDVLVVRVENLVPAERWGRRYDHIVNFEQMLSDEGTTIIKLFLHISREEQGQRLQDRLDRPEKHWKFDPADLKPRSKWNQYQEAFATALGRTSTQSSPWYVVPANRKWYRNLVVSEILVQTLQGLNMTFPEAAPDIASMSITD